MSAGKQSATTRPRSSKFQVWLDEATTSLTEATPRRNIKGSELLALFFAVLFVETLISPMISYAAHGLVVGWPVYLIWLAVVLIPNKRVLGRLIVQMRRRRFELVAFGLWTAVVLVNYLGGRGYAGGSHLIHTITLGMVLFLEMVYAAKGWRQRRYLLTSIVILLGLEALRSLPVLWTEANLARQMMLSGGAGALYRHGAMSGVGEYGYYTGCAIAYPYMVSLAQRRGGVAGLGMLVLCGALGIAIAIATFMGAILLMISGFLLLFLLTIIRGRMKLSSLGFLLLLAAGGLAAWGGFVSRSEQGSAFSDKLHRQVGAIAESGLVKGDQTNRSELWLMSIDTFLDNPVFGIGPVSTTENPYHGYKVGGHSSWLDLPAEYGIIGVLLFMSFIAAAIRRAVVISRLEGASLVSSARLGACVLFLIGGTYNPVIFAIPITALFFLLILSSTHAHDTRRSVKVQIRAISNVQLSGRRPEAGR